jgi:integrase
MRSSGAVSANRALAALSSFYAWAIDKEHHTGANPTADIKPLKETGRKRVLSETELVQIWPACEDDDHGQIVKLLMLTGQRREEIGGLEWSEFHTARRQIELPEHRVKNKQPHIVPLSEPALALLQGCVHDNYEGRRHVFGGGEGFVSWWYGKEQLDKRIAARRGAPLPHWTIHDLRRSVVTHVSEL